MKSILNKVADLKRFAVGKPTEREDADDQVGSCFAPHMRVLIVHSPLNIRWAERIEMDLAQALPGVLEGVRFSSQLFEIAGHFAEVEEQLQSYLMFDRDLRTAEYPFIITTGEWESEMVNTVREVCGITIPQIFCIQNVPKAVESPITTRRITNSLSGVFTRPTNPKEFQYAIRGTMPHIRTVCLLIGERDEYGENGEKCTAEQAAVAECFRRSGTRVLVHYWTEQDVRLVELEKRAQQADLFFLFTEPATTANIDVLYRIAVENRVLIAASDLDAVLDGAAIGGGVSGAAFSPMIMDLLLDVVLCRRNRFSAPICIPQQPGLHYSYENMMAQGLELDDEQYALLRMRAIGGPDDVVYRL